MSSESSKIERIKNRTFFPKQQQALASSARFLLYGGGAGGGKTEWAIFDALGLNNPGNGMRAIDYPEYQGLFLRRTTKQIQDVIKRTKDIYPIWGKSKSGELPVWHEQKSKWVFPSGAQILFGYIDKPDDYYHYQGWEYQWICFEELTQWPSSEPFMGLHTRLRRLESTPIQVGMRATCNPGGPGHQWVRNFWRINDVGDPQHFSVPVEVEVDGKKEIVDLDRQFIPSLLDENPFLSRAEYAATLEAPELSTQMRRALREGRWDVIDIKGTIYGEQLAELHNAGNVKDVPYDPRYPVNTFWDIGTADAVAVWFHQRIDGVDRFIDYYERSNAGLKEHWRELQSRPYNYAVHFVPHDADHRRQSAGGVIMTVRDIMYDLGMRNIELVPKTHLISHAIEATRIVLPRCMFDWSKTERGLECLTNYKYKVNPDGSQSLKPVHNEYCHGADAYRQFAQAQDLIDDALATSSEIPDDDEDDVPWSRVAYLAEQRDTRWIV